MGRWCFCYFTGQYLHNGGRSSHFHFQNVRSVIIVGSVWIVRSVIIVEIVENVENVRSVIIVMSVEIVGSVIIVGSDIDVIMGDALKLLSFPASDIGYCLFYTAPPPRLHSMGAWFPLVIDFAGRFYHNTFPICNR